MTDADALTFDAFADTDDCFQRRATRTPIGVPPHTHVCRESKWHDGPHVCICAGGTEF
jgi:hypothetical protein